MKKPLLTLGLLLGLYFGVHAQGAESSSEITLEDSLRISIRDSNKDSLIDTFVLAHYISSTKLVYSYDTVQNKLLLTSQHALVKRVIETFSNQNSDSLFEKVSTASSQGTTHFIPTTKDCLYSLSFFEEGDYLYTSYSLGKDIDVQGLGKFLYGSFTINNPLDKFHNDQKVIDLYYKDSSIELVYNEGYNGILIYYSESQNLKKAFFNEFNITDLLEKSSPGNYFILSDGRVFKKTD